MARKKKQEVVEDVEKSSEESEEQFMVVQQPQDISQTALRLQLLGLSKEILEHQSHLSWETHTKFMDVSIDDIIEGARELLAFVYEEYDDE